MATPSKGILRPVMGSEIRRMRAMAEEGCAAFEIAACLDRSESMVRNHCRGYLKPVRRSDRLQTVLAIVESSRRPLAVLACDLGYAHAASLSVTLCRARKKRAASAEARPRC